MLETIWEELTSHPPVRRTILIAIMAMCIYWATWSGLAVVAGIFAVTEILDRLSWKQRR